MNTTLQTVPFAHGDILTIQRGGIIHVVMPQVVSNMGLDWEPQRKRIDRHPILADTTSIMEVVTPAGMREATVMTLEGFHAFLVTLHPDRVKDPAVRERVIAYQRSAFRAVFEHFHGTMRVVPTKRASIAEFLRVGQALKKERNPALRAKLWAEMDRITDSWDQTPVGRAVGYSDPDHSERLADFWTAIHGLEETGMMLNQSRRNTILALHLPQIRQIFADTGCEIDIDRDLTEALRHSTLPRFIGFKAVNCKDGLVRRCWVFSAISPSGSEGEATA